MPYQDDGLITDFDVTIAAGPAYDLGTIALDLNRPLTTQVMVLFYFTAFTDGTTVSSQTWTNWYDPYLVQPSDSNGNVFLNFNDGTQVVTLDVTDLGTATTAAGTVFTRPLFSTGTKVRLMRAQDITNIAHTFAAGSRVTSTALNNSVGQIFKSMQEVEDRLVKVEGATFEDSTPLNLASGDLKANGGVVLETGLLALDLAASSMTNSLPYAKLSGTPTLGTAASVDTGTGVSDVIIGNDSRLTDSRAPTAHNQDADTITTGTLPVNRGGTGSATSPMIDVVTGADATASRSTLGLGTAAVLATGTGAGDVIIGNDARLTNSRLPTSIASFDSNDLSEGSTNLYHTTARASAAAPVQDVVAGTSMLRSENAGVITLSPVTNAASKLVALDSSSRLPAVDGSLLTNLPASAATVSYVTTAPSSPTVGDIWFDDAAGIFSIYVNDGGSSQWVDLSGKQGPTGPAPTLTGSYTGQIETAADKDYILDPGVATARTITGFYIKVNSGSGTVIAKLYNGSDLVKQVTAATSTGDQISLTNTSLAADAILKLELSANSSATDVIFAVEYTE